MVIEKKRILVVDASRVVRASLGKHLRERFELVEASSSEAAWQILTQESDFGTIISGVTPPKVDPYDLLRRLRASQIAPLTLMPLTLIVSDLKSHAERESDLERGVAGFITKTMKKEEIISHLEALLAATAKRQRLAPPASVRGLVARAEFSARLAALNLQAGPGASVCVLVFAIDDRELLIDRFGQDVAQVIDSLFARLLVAKVGALDLIGRCRGDRLAILTHGVDAKQGLRFGKQVCKGLAAGSISVRGQKVKLTASVGIASNSIDEAANGSALFARADERLEHALLCGGNMAAAECRPGCALCRQNDALSVPPKLGMLGLQVMPLLKMIDSELALGLPLAEIRRKLEARASSEE